MAKYKKPSRGRWKFFILSVIILTGMLVVWHYMEGNHPAVSSYTMPNINISPVPLP